MINIENNITTLQNLGNVICNNNETTITLKCLPTDMNHKWSVDITNETDGISNLSIGICEPNLDKVFLKANMILERHNRNHFYNVQKQIKDLLDKNNMMISIKNNEMILTDMSLTSCYSMNKEYFMT